MIATKPSSSNRNCTLPVIQQYTQRFTKRSIYFFMPTKSRRAKFSDISCLSSPRPTWLRSRTRSWGKPLQRWTVSGFSRPSGPSARPRIRQIAIPSLSPSSLTAALSRPSIRTATRSGRSALGPHSPRSTPSWARLEKVGTERSTKFRT